MDRMDEKHPVFEQLFLSDFNTWSFSALNSYHNYSIIVITIVIIVIIINNNNNNNKIPNNSENKNIIRTVLLPMLLIFQSIEQATQVNFKLFYKILDFEHFKCFEDLQNHTLNILKQKLTIDCLAGSCFLKAGKDFWKGAVQTVMTSKVMIKF